MGIMDLIDKARELIGDGGVDSLTEKAGDFSGVLDGEGNPVDEAQQAVEGLGEGGDVGEVAGDQSGGSEK